MSVHKTKPQNRSEEKQDGQAGSGRQHPTGSGPAYKDPKERGSAGGKVDKRGENRT